MLGGSSPLNVWQLPSPPPKRNVSPPYFASTSPRVQLKPFTRRRAARSRCLLMSYQYGWRMAKAGVWTSSRLAGTQTLPFFGITLCHEAYHLHPAYVSRISYAAYSAPRFAEP